MSAFNVSPARGFGFQQYINFGKHKGKTYYDVANAGDYKYLKWCYKSGKDSVKDSRSFFISDTCMPHIFSALSSENINITPWTKQISEEDDHGRCLCFYTAQDVTTHKEYQGPEIQMQRCSLCNMIKSLGVFQDEQNVCKKCWFTRETQVNKVAKMDQDEFVKGSKQSYKPRPYVPKPPPLYKQKMERIPETNY